MKKKVSLALLLAAGLVAVSPVSAMTEAELQAKLTKSYTVNGVKVQANEKQADMIKKYLDEFDVSTDDADKISEYVDQAIKAVEDSGAKSWKEVQDKGVVTKLADIATEASKLESVDVSLNSDGTIVVRNPKTGETWADKIKVTDSKVTNTDDSMTIVLSSGIAISLVGLLLVTKKVVKANA